MQAARKGGIRAGDGNAKAEQEANNSSMTAITSRRMTLSISLWVSLFQQARIAGLVLHGDPSTARAKARLTQAPTLYQAPDHRKNPTSLLFHWTRASTKDPH